MERNFYRRTSSIDSVVNSKNHSICFFSLYRIASGIKITNRSWYGSINVTLGTTLYLLGGLVPKLQTRETFRTMVDSLLYFI